MSGGRREGLRAARIAAGMTQQQAADAVGLTLRSYQRYESGGVAGRLEVWDALEDMFGVSQRELRATAPGGSR